MIHVKTYTKTASINLLVLMIGLVLLSACRMINRPLASTEATDTTPPTQAAEAPAPLSAFFGLDQALPRQANNICNQAEGQDGMPVVFPLELDLSTLQAGDFQVITRSGEIKTVYCVSPAPATDPGELRTILLIGDYGSKADQPARVNIVGNLVDKTAQFNFKGQSVVVTPLEAGPTLVLAQVAPENEWSQKNTRASICPSQTVQVVRVTWAGGVTRPDGKPVGDTERLAYQVTLRQSDGSERSITPFALADLDDNDNNHDLCLDVADLPARVSFKAGLLVDPANDLNPETEVKVTSSVVLRF